MWPFRPKAIPPAKAQEPPALKTASFLLGTGAGSYLASQGVGYERLALEGYAVNSAAFFCVNLLATAVSSVEPQLYKRGKGGKLSKVDDHPLLALLESPNPAQSGKEFFRHLAAYYLLSGNAYVFGNGADLNKPPAELQLLNPGKVKVKPGRGFFPQGYEYRPTPQTLTEYPVEQVSGRSTVLHLKTFNPLDPWCGLSPLLAAAYGIDVFNSGQRWNKRLLENDARPSGALTVKNAEGKPATLTEEQYQRLREMIDRMFSGADNAGRPLLLEGGLEWEQLSISPKDVDFLQGKHSSIRDIANAFGVPVQMLGVPEAQTFSNYEQAKLALWTDAAIPLLCLILEGLNRWLAPSYGEGLYLWYDEEMIPALEPLRKQKADRINAAGYMTVNEKRRAMGLDDVEGGGVLLVPSANVPLEMAGEIGLAEPGSEADGGETEDGEADGDGGGGETGE